MATYRQFFDSRFDRLEQHLKTMVADQKGTNDDASNGN